MKKFLSGLIVGVILAMSMPVMAETLVGKAIQGTFPVFVEGKILEKSAVVVDSTSYLPVRAISDAVGYDVFFENNQIKLTKKPTPSNEGYIAGDKNLVSDVVQLPNTMPRYLQKDGEWYIAINAFVNYFIDSNYTVQLPNRDPVRPVKIGTFSFYRLSDLGLRLIPGPEFNTLEWAD